MVRLDSQKQVALTVGQQLEYKTGYISKMGGKKSPVLVSATPVGCLMERHTSTQAGARAGFGGGAISVKSVFRAVTPGKAELTWETKTFKGIATRNAAVAVTIESS